MKPELASSFITITLPVVLSREARREGLVASAMQPKRVQVLAFEYQSLTELNREQRERVVDVWERITRGGDVDEDGTPLEPEVIGYEQLCWHAGRWYLEGIWLDEVFFATPGRTLPLLEYLRRELENQEALETMLNQAPLINDLAEGELTLDVVLAAYDQAFELARRIRQLARHGQHSEDAWMVMSDSLIFIRPRDGGRPVGLLHDSDPNAFREAQELMVSVERSSPNSAALGRFAEEVCRAADQFVFLDQIETDADLVRLAMRDQADNFRRAQEADQSYDRERSRWILEHGSQRLKLAAERGYKHDGIYRDERLAEDFPGFIGTLGKRVEVREVVNPTEDAVELESEAIERVAALGLEDVRVRIVWVVSRDLEVSDGEYIQLAGYLSRHTVYRRVKDADDDIPF